MLKCIEYGKKEMFNRKNKKKGSSNNNVDLVFIKQC